VKTAWWLGLSATAVWAGCSAGAGTSGSNDPIGGGSGSTSGSGGEGSLQFGSGASDGSGATFGGPFGVPVGGPGDASCSSVSQKAEKTSGLADVILAIDNSGSMTAEAAAVQQKLNFFSSFIASTGIDVHVVLLSERPAPPLIPGIISLVNGVCVDPPLGTAGACPNGDDTNFAAGYMHWVVMVNSNDVLSVIQNTYAANGTGWKGMLRLNATKTFVIVTDDNAQGAPSAAEFVTWVNGLPEFKGSVWRYSGVYCLPNGVQGNNCANIGDVHAALTAQTGGVAADMGNPNPDWDAVFKQIGDAVVKDAKPVDCAWKIPPPPDGKLLETGKVNVVFTPTSGVAQTIYSLGSSAECTATDGGWYYDNAANPTTVLACPSSCTKMQADLNAKVDVLFGCESQHPPIK
jgi:hypothetical protein